MGETRVIGGEWHLMNKGHIRVVQLRNHVEQYLSACCKHNMQLHFTATDFIIIIAEFLLHEKAQRITTVHEKHSRKNTKK